FLLALLALGLILHQLIWVLVQLFVACIVAAAMAPISDATIARFHRVKNRGLVVVCVFIAASAITVVFGFFVLRAIVREMSALVADLPRYSDAFKVWLATVVAAYPSIQDVDLQTWIALNARVTLNGLSSGLGGTLEALSFAATFLGGFLTVVLTV